jgi:hypothetical protein
MAKIRLKGVLKALYEFRIVLILQANFKDDFN